MAQSKQKKWLAFIVLTIAAGLIYRVPYLKTVFYDPLVQAFGVTNTEVGTMMSVYSLTKTILYIPAGILEQVAGLRPLRVFQRRLGKPDARRRDAQHRQRPQQRQVTPRPFWQFGFHNTASFPGFL